MAETGEERTGLEVVRNGAVAEIWFDAPPVNALTHDTWRSFLACLDELAIDDDLSVLLIRGRGKGFCAGADLKFSGGMDTATRRSKHRTEGNALEVLYNFPAATICVMHGFAVGAGVTIATLCDVRIASQETMLSMPEIRWGLSVASGGARITRVGVRQGRLREMLFTGRKYSADEAAEIGLLDYSVAPDQLESKVAELTAQITAQTPHLIKLMKAGMNAAERVRGWDTGHAASYDYTVQMRNTANPKARTDGFFTR